MLKRVNLLQKAAAAMVRIPLNTTERRVASALILLLVVVAISTSWLLSRPRKAISYTSAGTTLPVTGLSGATMGISFHMEGNAFEILGQSPVSGALVPEGCARQFMLSHAAAYNDTLHLHPRGNEPSRLISLSSFKQGRFLPALRHPKLSRTEIPLQPHDTTTFRSKPKEALQLHISAVPGVEVSGSGHYQGARITGSGIMLSELAGDPAQVDVVAGSKDSDRVTFFITVQMGSVTMSSEIPDSLKPVTLVLENCRGIHFRLPTPWDGSISPVVLVQDTTARRLSRLIGIDAWNFSFATFLGIGARITIGSHDDTAKAIHTFEVRGSQKAGLTFNRRDGFRYEGISNRVILNGDDLVAQNGKNIPAPILAPIITAELGGLAWLLVILLRMRQSSGS